MRVGNLRSTGMLLLGSVAWLTPLVAAVDFYVSPEGSEDNDGSLEAPFQTLHQAQLAVRDALASDDEGIVVNIADGTCTLSEPLVFGAEDSGKTGDPVTWKADGSKAVISGGLGVTDWVETGSDGIYSAQIPPGTKSRNLYVNGNAANYARRMVARTAFGFNNRSMTWDSSEYDWLMESDGIAGAEVRFINSFTDRYAPIESVGDRELVMVNHTWANQIIGYDTANEPHADFGVWVQNARSLLTEGGQFYCDSAAGTVYYMPLAEEDMATVDAYLGVLEALVVVGGTYDEPTHDISFEGLNFAHTTWLKPGEGFGYIDQQTGGYIGENITFPEFEATRPTWFQMPSAIQVSAAHAISFVGGTYTQLGSGGFGIGNDDNAHLSEVGLGASNVSVTEGYFTQVMGNSITAGGILADAHHPSDPRMVVSHITVSENVFYNVSSLFSSTVPIFVSYIQDSTITNNDLSTIPYSGICHGYGWGANDAGGSDEYIERGLYQYQPLYSTPTTSQNNLIEGNLIHKYGLSHTDLGSIYTLSKSPSTYVNENYAFDSAHFGKYTDEGANSLIVTNNVFLSNGNWYAPNAGCLTCGWHTANNTFIDNFGRVGYDQVNEPDGTADFNNTFVRNWNVTSLSQTSVAAQRVAYRAGISPANRQDRSVSNEEVPDGHVALDFLMNYDNHSTVLVNFTNFDDVAYTAADFEVTVSDGYELKAIDKPSTIAADSTDQAIYEVAGGCISCLPPTIAVEVSYINPRTGSANTLSTTGTMPGTSLINEDSELIPSSSWEPAAFGATGDVLGIRVGGRGIEIPYDDWAGLYVSGASEVAARLVSLDTMDSPTRGGVVVRGDMAGDNTTYIPPYAGLFVTADNTAVFQYASGEDGIDTTVASIPDVSLPVCLRIAVVDNSAAAYYSKSEDCSEWTGLEGVVDLGFHEELDAGIVVSSGGGFREATGLFSQFSYA
ncbi:hypothetical protein FQN54_004701 [Arachnomyces sp. PD_36]|nr:hypothetical protein FQN54_004701 [Arachnomyces sp. PD_36]